MNASTVVERFKRTFDESSLNELGKATRLCRRERDATPYRLMMALIQAFAAGPLDSIASIHRTFNALCERQMQYKPFHNQLAKRGFAHFMRLMLTRLLNELACSVLRFTPDSPFSRFKQIRTQDGTSFAVKSTLAQTFPGRFTTVSPAAVELHVSLELNSVMVNQVTLSADSAAERQYLPAPQELVGELLLADRGYYSKGYLRELDEAGGFFIVRGKTNLNPRIRKAIRPDGSEIKAWRNKPLKAVKARLHKYPCVDLDVCFGDDDDEEGVFECRFILLCALMIQGVTTDPMISDNSPGVVYTIYIVLLLALVFMAVVVSVAIKPISQVLRIPKVILFSVILMMCVAGSYAIRANEFDVFVILGAGLLGYVLRLFGIPVAPLLISSILTRPFEESLRQSLIKSEGNLLIFVTQPIAAFFLALAVAMLAFTVWRHRRATVALPGST